MSAGWTELPSARLKNIKCADPFASRADQFKTKFGSCFNSGGFPCRLSHGAANVSLRWSKDPSLLDFDPYLVICAEGLCETEHPYAFASRACFQALIRELSPGVMYCRETIPSERRERAREANCTTTSGVRIFSTRIRKFISY